LVDTLEVREKMQMNKRRLFSDAFKTEAVRRVRVEGRPPATVARELDVPRQILGKWLERAEELTGEAKKGQSLSVDEREELARLRKENERLKMERDILKKATAFFARESS
jgi:transposase